MYNSNAGASIGGTGDSTSSTQFYFDYSFLRKFEKINLVITTGVNGYHSTIRGKTFGDVSSVPINPGPRQQHPGTGSQRVVYIQAEKKFFKEPDSYRRYAFGVCHARLYHC